ncbi:uncharacterized protein LOC130552601 [Triplophysa rosa]|uniref:uncharacterized protein LOC130552601 n=1 Tax=Triplophysa rosa TaxID=992332 RepID=UPI002545D20C|nr:uncharacterized protein LOC130552601 [Triplophysa rosa]
MTQPSNEEDMGEQLETRSCCSRASRSSQFSSASGMAIRARAKAEAARAQLVFAKKEAEMMREEAYIVEEAARKKAELKANLHTLQLERVAAAAIAEAEVLEAAAEEQLRETDRKSSISLSVQNLAQFSSEGVTSTGMQHSVPNPLPDLKALDLSCPPLPQQKKDNGETARSYMRRSHVQSSEISDYEFSELPAQHPVKKSTNWNSVSDPFIVSSPRDPYHYSDQPQGARMQHNDLQSSRWQANPSTQMDLTRYLLRREMVSSGLLKFDDHAENYWAWKASFLGATEDLNLSPTEELDLLCKWLGPSSSEQARRIRAVHIQKPSAGLRMLWQRLEDIYGSSEVIENALLKKVEQFPSISIRDNLKLRELGDTLMELEAACADGYLPGLAYLNTSRGVNPIAQKLPQYLQERWITLGAQYKEHNGVPYPPFSVFVKFVCDQAKVRNDPSFADIAVGSSSAIKFERGPLHKPYVKPTVATRRTEVSTNLENAHAKAPEKKVNDPDKQCPLHNKPHPLRKCRSFRGKTLDERKT